MSTIKSVYNVTTTLSNSEKSEVYEVTGAGQSAAQAVIKKFKGKTIRKILLGFQINNEFIPLRLKSV